MSKPANFENRFISEGGAQLEVTKKTIAVAKGGIGKGAASERTTESEGHVQKKEDYYGKSHMLMNEMAEIEGSLDDVDDGRLEQLKENCQKMWKMGSELLGGEKRAAYDETVANYQERLAEMIMTLNEKLGSSKSTMSPLTPSSMSEKAFSPEDSTLGSPTFSQSFSSQTDSASSDEIISKDATTELIEQARRNAIAARFGSSGIGRKV